MADKTRRTGRARAARAHAKATALKGKVVETDWGAPKKREVW